LSKEQQRLAEGWCGAGPIAVGRSAENDPPRYFRILPVLRCTPSVQLPPMEK